MIIEKKILLGVGVTNATKKEILEYILQSLKKEDEKYYVVTPNPEILVYANKHNDFRTILNSARLALCDGVGVMWSGKFLGKNFKQRLTGTDFVENLCKEVAKQPITVGFLGGSAGVAERAAECLVRKYPGLKVVFAQEEWPSSTSNTLRGPAALETKRYTLNAIRYIDILFVAFGFPKQEEWMSKNLPKIPVRIAIGVGGAFDYISGNVPRAPLVIRKIGFEWFFRLLRQPWRIKRQIALFKFIRLIVFEKLFPLSSQPKISAKH